MPVRAAGHISGLLNGNDTKLMGYLQHRSVKKL
jgi:hypothetical protein